MNTKISSIYIIYMDVILCQRSMVIEILLFVRNTMYFCSYILFFYLFIDNTCMNTKTLEFILPIKIVLFFTKDMLAIIFYLYI